MANKTTDMSKIRKVIKFYSDGKSKLFISSYLSLSRNTVKKYISLFEVLGLSFEIISEKTDAELELLFKIPLKTGKIIKEVAKKSQYLSLIWTAPLPKDGNVVFTKHILDGMQFKGSILLVTSSFHMRRTLATFNKAGYKNITPFITNKFTRNRRFDFY